MFSTIRFVHKSQPTYLPHRSAHRIMPNLIMLACFWGLSAAGEPPQWTPAKPQRHETVIIQLPHAMPGDELHWAVNVDAESWEQPVKPYWPADSQLYGPAVRTPFSVDDKGVGTVVLGPFNMDEQIPDAVVFAIARKDGSWDNNRGEDYLIPLHAGRITFAPENPTANDIILVTIHDHTAGGMLRWGVNETRGQWIPVHPAYWPAGTEMYRDGVGVDTPLPPPDEQGQAVIELGPFNAGPQVVHSLHMAVHWDDVWDTDGGRNYNLDIVPATAEQDAPALQAIPDTTTNDDRVTVALAAAMEQPVEIWVDGILVDLLTPPATQTTLDLAGQPYGHRHVVARVQHTDGRVAMDQQTFWHLPDIEEHRLPDGTAFGATDHGDGWVTFALYAPHKRFVNLVGDFNKWGTEEQLMYFDPVADTWWLTIELEPGTYQYQYAVDGEKRLGDPYARQVDWTLPDGRKGWHPEDARTVLTIGGPAFEWTATDYERPALEELVIYELYIEDFVPGEGFAGLEAKLDYIADLGFNAIEPLPWHPWPGDESWGYNPAFHFAVEQMYGTPHDLKRLIDAAHSRGIAVIIDMVLNHAEWGSPIYQLYAGDYDASPYFREYDGHNWGFPKIDQESEAVKRYTSDVIRFWIEQYRIDGFRYDATRWTGWQGYNDWGASWYAYVARQADPDNIQIAEHLPIEPPLITDTEMDTGWHAEYRWRIRELIQRAELDPYAFDEALDGRRVGFDHSFQRMPYTESHDEERVMHDLKAADFPPDEQLRRAKLAIALPLLTPGVPMIYAGQEFGEYTEKFVGWNPLNWELLETPTGQALHAFTRRLVRLRTRHPALQADNVRIEAMDPDSGLAIFVRDSAPHRVWVALNFGRAPVNAEVELADDISWTSVDATNRPVEGTVEFTLQPGEVQIWASDLPDDAVTP